MHSAYIDSLREYIFSVMPCINTAVCTLQNVGWDCYVRMQTRLGFLSFARVTGLLALQGYNRVESVCPYTVVIGASERRKHNVLYVPDDRGVN